MEAITFIITVLLLVNVTQSQYWYNCSCENTDQEVFTNLFEDGCCSDRVECPSHHEPKYLAVDVFMKVWSDPNPYLFLVHQQNMVVTEVFKPNLKIKEIHTGHLNYSKTAFKQSFTSYCPQNQNVSNLVTGFSVEVDTGKKTYIVCGDQVLVGGIQNYDSSTEVKFEASTMDDACNKIHPVFCPNEDGQLISIAVIPTQKNDKNPYIYGYYTEERQSETREKREYYVKAWRWDNKDANKSDDNTKVEGYLAEIDTFGETEEDEMLGLYFTIDGNACLFRRKFENRPTLEIEDTSVPRKPCLSFQAFIGCPTPWCFDIKMDASFSYTEGNKSKVVLFKGFFYWILEDIGLPFEVPSYKFAYKIFNTANGYWKPLCERYTGYQKAPVCLPPSVEAAFGARVSGQQLIYIRDSVKNEATINEFGTKAGIEMTKKDPITKDDTSNTEAAIFDQESETAFMFSGKTYKAYKYEDKNNWKHLEDNSGNLADSNIDFNNVDAGVNLRNNKSYIFSNNWYYEVIYADGKLKANNSQMVGIDRFFDVRKECYYNNQEQYYEVLSRYEGRIRSPQGDAEKVTARQDVQQATKKGKLTAIYITLIVLCGVGIVVAAWIAMFFYDSRSEPEKRGRSARAGKKTGQKDTRNPFLKSKSVQRKGMSKAQ